MGLTPQLSKSALVLITAASALAMFMAALDSTIVNVALPTISEEFHISSSAVSWVSTIYLLVNGGFLFLAGTLINVVGYKKMFLIGFGLFTFGSFACGFFPNLFDAFPLLLAARAVQGLGASIMAVISPALISRFIPEAGQAKAMAIVMIMIGVGSALGPTLGGLLTDSLGWNWVFYINIPIGLIAILTGLFVLPKDSAEKIALKGFDGIGAGLVFVGLASLLFLISEGEVLGWTSVPVILSLIMAVGGIGGFILRERRCAHPLLDLRLFKNVPFLMINLIYALIFLIFAGTNYLIPFYLQLVKGMSVSASGLLIAATSVGLVIAGFIAGQLYTKLAGKRRYILMGGTLLAALSFFFLSHLHPWSGTGLIIASLVLLGLGVGFTTTPVTTMLLQSVPPEKAGMVSSLNGLERYAPMTMGIAFFNIILITGVKYVAGHAGIVSRPPHEIAANILTTGFDLCFIVSLLVAIAVFVLCFFVNEKKLFCKK